jgi:uncharacterized protein (TIGR03435 family)
LNVFRKSVLAAAAIIAGGIPIAVGAMNFAQTAAPSQANQQFRFEVASVRAAKSGTQNFMIRMNPGGRFSASGITLKSLLEIAYDVKDAQVAGLPPWADSERYEIEAKPDETSLAAFNKLPRDEREAAMRQMLQELATDRFKLSLSHETKDLPVYVLAVAKNGPKFRESAFKPPETLPDAPPGPGARPMHMGEHREMIGEGMRINGRGELSATYGAMKMLVNVLSRIVGKPIVDKTGLTGRYDFTLKWTPDEAQLAAMPGGPRRPGDDAPPPDASGPTLFTAIQEQLGLKLEAEKAPMDVLVVQHVEHPSEN